MTKTFSLSVASCLLVLTEYVSEPPQDVCGVAWQRTGVSFDVTVHLAAFIEE